MPVRVTVTLASQRRGAGHRAGKKVRMQRRLAAIVLAAMIIAAPLLSASAESFSGAGSTFAHPILARWGQAYASLQGEGGSAFAADGGFDYEPVGSTAGIMRVLQGAVEFGATDVALSPAELDQHRLAQFPIGSGGVAVVVNLRGVGSDALRLSGPVLARIYLGSITRWSDPAIAALNTGLALPDAPITVIQRSDGSGTSWHFARYLSGSSAEWQGRVGVDTQPKWPVGTGARGNSEVADRVQGTENAIGYVEASQAQRRGLSVVLLENRAGHYVAPSVPALRTALSSMGWDAAQHFHGAEPDARAAEAYPIVATVFALMPRQPGSSRRSRQAMDFFRFALTERATDAELLGYVPLPDTAVQQVIDYWRVALTR
jgi:phosphate transport system substrate-binding protein